MKLFIIGNGFDKYCELNSSFSDYFNNEYQYLGNHFFNKKHGDVSVGEVNNYYNDKSKEYEDLTFIEKYIMYNKHQRKVFYLHWSHVEGMINHLLTKNRMEKIHERISNYTDIRKHLPDKSELAILSHMLYREFYKKDNQFIVGTLEDLYDKIKKDLKRFEIKFKEYLRKEVDQKSATYEDRTTLLLNKIFKDRNYKVLTFNYTSPKPFIGIEVEFVHGSLHSDNIIIGIDSTPISYTDNSYIFTKTYRKVEQFTISDRKIVNDILNDEFEEIVFFGHSLNKQDYAYFQTVFDRYNLYESNIKLTFYYNVYDRNNTELIKREQVSGVIELIETYGNTLDNKAKGKNLLHKLLNESRLKIVEI